MIKSITIVIAVLALFAVSGNTFAQDDAGANEDRQNRQSQHRGSWRGAGDPAMMIGRMAEHLDLDEVQQQSITNIMQAAKPEFEVLREASKTNRESIVELDVDDPDYGSKLQNLSVTSGELATELTLLTGRVRSEIAGVLTSEQRQVLEERMSQMGRSRTEDSRRHGNREPAR